MSKHQDFSGVFQMKPESEDRGDLQASLAMRLEELGSITYGLAVGANNQSGEDFGPIFWHIHHCLEDTRTIFKAFTEELYPRAKPVEQDS